MNARTFKKQCKAAMAELIKNHGLKQRDFVMSEPGETWSYFHRFVKKFPRHQQFRYRYCGSSEYIRLAKNTPLFSWFDSYAGDGDGEPAVDTLQRTKFWYSPEINGGAQC